MNSYSIKVDVLDFLKTKNEERLNERITVPVSTKTLERLERLGKRKNDFIRTLIENALPLLDQAETKAKIA